MIHYTEIHTEALEFEDAEIERLDGGAYLISGVSTITGKDLTEDQLDDINSNYSWYIDELHHRR